MKQIIFFVISLFLFACNKDENLPSYIENENGVTLSQPFLWKTNLTNSGYIGTLIRPSLIYNDNIILGAFNDKKCEIALIDIESGEKEWQKPYFSKEFALTNSAYMYKNLAFCDSEVDDFHCLDMVTGSIIWKIDKEGWFEVQSPTGINETCFMCGASENNPKPYEVQAVWYGDINTGDVNELYYPDLGSEADTCYNVRNYNQAGGVEKVTPYKNSQGEILLVIYYRSYVAGPGGEDFFSLYNFSKKEFVYQDVKLNSGNDGQIQIKNDKIYFTLWEGVFCYDLFTGQKIWDVPLNYRTSWGGFIYDDKLFGIEVELNTADSYLFCIDINTGKMLWRVLSVQCSAPIRYLNGVVYFVASGDHKLHAYDSETGKQLWHIESPDFKNDEGAFFKPECSVVPGKNGEKGKVIVSSYFNAFCYEAIR